MEKKYYFVKVFGVEDLIAAMSDDLPGFIRPEDEEEFRNTVLPHECDEQILNQTDVDDLVEEASKDTLDWLLEKGFISDIKDYSGHLD